MKLSEKSSLRNICSFNGQIFFLILSEIAREEITPQMGTTQDHWV